MLTREPLQYSDMKCRHEKNTLWSVDNINVYMENFAQECNNFAICDLKLHLPLGEIDVKANYKIVSNQHGGGGGGVGFYKNGVWG
jgi:hypothetical protein